MSSILLVNSSVREKGSQTRMLAEHFVKHCTSKNASTKLVTRDVGINPPPHPTEKYTVANYTPPDKRTPDMDKVLEASNGLIDELTQANQVVFAVPMYNFNVPSTFKAYIDNLVRVGKTFTATDSGEFVGMLNNKKVLVITARGAVYGDNSPINDFDHQEPYLRTVLGFMGMNEVSFVHADGMDFADKQYRDASLSRAKATLEGIAESW